ncbi:MAG: DinB family protein [Dehalococcoidia bacterium]
MEQEEVIARLEAMPERLRVAFATAGAGAADRAPSPGEWSAQELLAHIRSVDALLAPYIVLLTVLEKPAFSGADERALAERAGYLEDDVETALTAFTTRRGELVRLLKRLNAADRQRESVHTAYGRFTIADYAAHLAAHEQEHLPEVERALGVGEGAVGHG